MGVGRCGKVWESVKAFRGVEASPKLFKKVQSVAVWECLGDRQTGH